MSFYFFVEGSLLQILIILFLAGMLTRISFFICTTIQSLKNKEKNQRDTLKILASSLLPFHKAFIKKPFYAALRYAFHVCLFAVPVGLSGHIVLWSESRFEWDWIALPDTLADGMTLFVLVLLTYFLLRRILSNDVRQDTSIPDMILIITTALPFLTGYFLSHDTFYSIPVLGDNMAVIHMLSGEGMILMGLFLFYSTRLNARKCIGCASCVQNCPTETLESYDKKDLRIFGYAHFQCICCGLCVNVCPEDAAGLQHEINAKRFTQIFSKREIRTVKLEMCRQCGNFFSPESQVGKIGIAFAYDYIHYCPNCRKIGIGNHLHQLSPWHKHMKKR